MKPFVFDPYFRPQVWGGRRLEEYLGRPLPGPGGYGEAWVLSGQTHHVSRVVEGPLAGTPLTELWAQRAEELLGRPPARPQPFPLLFKYLDCEELLSIQVHPDDALAQRLRPGELGKTEAWIVLAAAPAARVYAGLCEGVARAEIERRLADGTLAECLHSFVPEPGQCLFLPAGTVHAVGGGVLMAEVQQSSDCTFRLFDWNRPGPDGKLRALHVEEALQAIDWSAGPVRPARGRPLEHLPAPCRGERLVECAHFAIDRVRLAGPMALPDARPLAVWMLLSGEAELSGADYRRRFRQGETVLVPATAGPLRWTPQSAEPPTLLAVPVVAA